MRCEQIAPYLPGFAGGDLRPDTASVVATHVDRCVACSDGLASQTRALAGLATLARQDVEPPAFLFDSILEAAGEQRIRRLIPLMPLPVADVGRIIAENRDTIASAAGTALVAAGAAYALWRAVRSPKVRPVIS